MPLILNELEQFKIQVALGPCANVQMPEVSWFLNKDRDLFAQQASHLLPAFTFLCLPKGPTKGGSEGNLSAGGNRSGGSREAPNESGAVYRSA